MTTERKKCIKIIALSVLAVLLVFIAVCACVPFLRHRVLRVPIKTEELFPEPDEIICYHGGEKYTFNKEQTEILYHIFANTMDNIDNFERNNTSPDTWSSYELQWEFRYYDCYRYAGDLQTDELFARKLFVFNNIKMQSRNGLQLHYAPQIYQNQCVTAILQDYSAVGEFNAMLEKFAIANLMDTSLWKVTDTETVVSNAWPAKPDSIYVYKDGKSTEVTGAELDNVYQQFMPSIGRYGWGEQSAGYYGYGMSCVANGVICFEFRYKKRQMYMPDEIPDRKLFVPFEILYKEFEYDSLLFVVEDLEYSEDYQVRIACYGPQIGLARGSHNMASQPSFIKGSFVEYLSTVLE